MIRAVTTRTPEWTETDRSTVLAYLDYEDLTCTCGGFIPETTDPDNEGAYVAERPQRCWRCDAIERQRADYDGDDSVKFPSALKVWPVTKRRRDG